MATIMVKTKYRLSKSDLFGFIFFWSNIINCTVLKLFFTYNKFFQVEAIPRNISIQIFNYFLSVSYQQCHDVQEW